MASTIPDPHSLDYSPEFFSFVQEHIRDSPSVLMLKYAGKDTGIPLKEAVTQISARQKTSKKLPSFLLHKEFLFPDAIAAEQASNEKVATYHASLIPDGASVIDLTAGLGIDAMSLATRAGHVTALEKDKAKAEALIHNSKVMGRKNMEILHTACEDFLSSSSQCFDVAFIDPARRKDDDSRAYSLGDCTPDLAVIYPLLAERCGEIIVKASPMLDLRAASQYIPGVRQVSAVSFLGECREVFMRILPESKVDAEPCVFSAVIISSDGSVNEWKEIPSMASGCCGEPPLMTTPFSESRHPDLLEGQYLYHPDPALMKINAFPALQRQYPALRKAAPNTHLYLAAELYEDFPGRVLRIESVPEGKMLKSIKGTHLNAVSRNHPMKAEEIARKYRLKASDTQFLYAVGLGPKAVPAFLLATKLI